MDSMPESKKSPDLQDEIVRTDRRTWNEREWEACMKSVEISLSESLSLNREVVSQHSSVSMYELSSSVCSEELSKIVQQLLARLSERQVLVISKIFWDGKSERAIAREMKISRQAVYDLKRRALNNLRKHAQGVLASSPIVQADPSLTADKHSEADDNSAA